jgi:hypothetical protein
MSVEHSDRSMLSQTCDDGKSFSPVQHPPGMTCEQRANNAAFILRSKHRKHRVVKRGNNTYLLVKIKYHLATIHGVKVYKATCRFTTK